MSADVIDSEQPGDYLVPLKTFWLPFYADDNIIDPNSKEAKDWLIYREIPIIENRGQFQAPAIK